MCDTNTKIHNEPSAALAPAKDCEPLPTATDYQPIPTAPDGGWGWVVVLASFMCHLIADGVAFSSGVLFSAFLKHFNESKSLTSWIPSIFMGLPLICGPLASSITSLYGCRITTIFGGILSTIGFFVSSYANSINIICLTFGVICGIAMSFIYMPAVVIVSFYFEKKRALATGLAVSGSGAGAASFGPFIEYLIENYGWRNTFKILAGLSLLFIMSGCAFSSVKLSNKQQIQVSLFAFEKTVSKRKTSNKLFRPPNTQRICNNLNLNKFHSTIDLPTYLKGNDITLFNKIVLKERIYEPKEQFMDNLFHALERKSRAIINIKRTHSLTNVSRQIATESPGISRPLTVDAEVQCTDLISTKGVASKCSHYSRLTKTFSRIDIFYPYNPANLSNSCPNFILSESRIKKETNGNPGSRCIALIKVVFTETFDCTDFKNVLFSIFAVANFILYLWSDTPYIFLHNRIVKLGYSVWKGSMVITAIGISNTIGLAVFGWLGDVDQNRVFVIYGCGIIVCGIVLIIMPFCTQYSVIMCLSAIYGFGISVNYSLSVIVLVHICGINRLTKSYGVLSLICGIGNLIGPPFAGYLSDVSGSYNNAFYCGGASIMFCGTLTFLCLLPSLRKYRH